MRKPSDLPTAGMQGIRAGSIDTAPEERRFRGRREVGDTNDRLGHSIWPLWVSEDYGSAQGRGKIERFNRRIKEKICLMVYCSPGELKKAVDDAIAIYNRNPSQVA